MRKMYRSIAHITLQCASTKKEKRSKLEEFVSREDCFNITRPSRQQKKPHP